ncbi:hypothetical protein ACGFIF_42995 [Kribbella sp. NPDC049174]|uniref:hypothetical protein n=1 Tax=Kribbella sp. NPDC049174 TaxID=3364112 RepID=UPI00371F57B4
MSRIVLPPAEPPGPEWWPPYRRRHPIMSAALPPADAVSVAQTTCVCAFTLALALAVLGYDLVAIAAFIAAVTAAVTTAYVRMVGAFPVRRRYLGRRDR